MPLVEKSKTLPDPVELSFIAPRRRFSARMMLRLARTVKHMFLSLRQSAATLSGCSLAHESWHFHHNRSLAGIGDRSAAVEEATSSHSVEFYEQRLTKAGAGTGTRLVRALSGQALSPCHHAPLSPKKKANGGARPTKHAGCIAHSIHASLFYHKPINQLDRLPPPPRPVVASFSLP